MGFCWSCVRISSYVLVAFVAVLFFFHLECTKEREEAKLEKKGITNEFKPEETDVNDYQMKFSPKGVNVEVRISLLMTFAPCPLKKLFLFACGQDRTATKNKDYAAEVRDENGEWMRLDYKKGDGEADARKRDQKVPSYYGAAHLEAVSGRQTNGLDLQRCSWGGRSDGPTSSSGAPPRLPPEYNRKDNVS